MEFITGRPDAIGREFAPADVVTTIIALDQEMIDDGIEEALEIACGRVTTVIVLYDDGYVSAGHAVRRPATKPNGLLARRNALFSARRRAAFSRARLAEASPSDSEREREPA